MSGELGDLILCFIGRIRRWRKGSFVSCKTNL